jgi:oligopeptide transport system substrate-binding protein
VITQAISRSRRLFAAAALACAVAAAPAAAQTKVMQMPIRTDGPKVLDPVQGSTTYDNMACAQIYETLLTNKYADPYEYEPLLLAELPTSDDGGLTWNFRLKDGVRFQDNACFPGGKGREVVTDDVFYSLKRLADKKYRMENWWLVDDTIAGFNDYKDQQNASEKFDYDAPVEGFIKVDDRRFQIKLTKPVTRFLWVLTMFQTSIVPREAVERYGDDFAFRAVGTGPFVLDSFIPKQSLALNRNPNYHEVLYPARDEWSREDQRRRLHRAAGQRIPFVDRLEFTMFVEDQPMWLKFRAGELGYSEVPDEYFAEAFDKRTRRLLPSLAQQGVEYHASQLLDLIFRGFNMEDPVLGLYEADGKTISEKNKALRHAISLAIDLQEINDTFYSGICVVYDGPIPPNLDGHPEGGKAPVSYRGPNIELAKQKLAQAGYPEGRGLAPIRFYTNRGGNSPEQTEMLKRQLQRIGVRLDVQLVDFSTLIESVNNKKAPMFSFAWASDYPDAENNLALFYGPNESPGSNHYNYKRAEYDEMYRQILTMLPGPERTAIYEKMRDMVIEDTPYVGSLCRTRHYLINPWLLNCRPTELYYGWFKYLDVDDSKRPGGRR